MRTLSLAAHVAHLDEMTGCGLLVCPRAVDDVPSPLGGGSLHAAEWDSLVRVLDAQGWEPLAGDDGLPVVDGYMLDDRPVVGLYGREPIIGDPTAEQIAESTAALHRAAGTAVYVTA